MATPRKGTVAQTARVSQVGSFVSDISRITVATPKVSAAKMNLPFGMGKHMSTPSSSKMKAMTARSSIVSPVVPFKKPGVPRLRLPVPSMIEKQKSSGISGIKSARPRVTSMLEK